MSLEKPARPKLWVSTSWVLLFRCLVALKHPKRPNREQERTLHSFFLSLSFSVCEVGVHALVSLHRMSILSKSGNCTYLGPPPCLSEPSTNAFRRILLVMFFLDTLLAPLQPIHTWNTHLLKKGSGNREGINSENVLDRLRDSRHGHNSHWWGQRRAKYVMNLLLAHVVYSSLVLAVALWSI